MIQYRMEVTILLVNKKKLEGARIPINFLRGLDCLLISGFDTYIARQNGANK